MCFENVFEEMPCFRRPMYLTRVWVFYKSVDLFEKMFSNVFESLFESVVDCGFLKRRQVFLQAWSQVTKSFVYPIMLKGFRHVLTPFNNFVPPLKLMDNLAFRKFIRDGRGSSYGPRMQWCQVSLANCFEGTMIIPFRQHFEGLMIIWLFCQRHSTCKHGPFWKATCGITLRGASVIVYWLHVFVLY